VYFAHPPFPSRQVEVTGIREPVTSRVEGRICAWRGCHKDISHLARQARYCRDIVCCCRRGAFRTAKWRRKNTLLAPREGNRRQDRAVRQTGVARMVDGGISPALHRDDRGWAVHNLRYQLDLLTALCEDEDDSLREQRLRRAVTAGLRFSGGRDLGGRLEADDGGLGSAPGRADREPPERTKMSVTPEDLDKLAAAVATLEKHGAPMEHVLSDVAERHDARQRAAEAVATVIVAGLAEVLASRGGDDVGRG
jgi:hypothetical protein